MAFEFRIPENHNPDAPPAWQLWCNGECIGAVWKLSFVDNFCWHLWSIVQGRSSDAVTAKAAIVDAAKRLHVTAEMETAALVALAQANIDADIQELLLRGNPNRDVAPGALRAAIRAALRIAHETPEAK